VLLVFLALAGGGLGCDAGHRRPALGADTLDGGGSADAGGNQGGGGTAGGGESGDGGPTEVGGAAGHYDPDPPNPPPLPPPPDPAKFTAEAFCGSDGMARRTSAEWATAYADAACACPTQSCLGDLQIEFAHALGCVSYDESRDGETYTRESQRAVLCYAEAPNQ
jgi:hypothetical protein